jgi:hypothetical protein
LNTSQEAKIHEEEANFPSRTTRNPLIELIPQPVELMASRGPAVRLAEQNWPAREQSAAAQTLGLPCEKGLYALAQNMDYCASL